MKLVKERAVAARRAVRVDASRAQLRREKALLEAEVDQIAWPWDRNLSLARDNVIVELERLG